MINLIKDGTSFKLEVNHPILRPPYARYLSSGGIGEKIFEEFCNQNRLQFTKPLNLMWGVYLNHLKGKYGKLTYVNLKKSEKFGCEKILSNLSEEQITFLTENFVINSKSNFDFIGFPDYVVWDNDKNIVLVEIKSRGGLGLSKKQIEIHKKLEKHFKILVCWVNFTATIQKLLINNVGVSFFNFHKVIYESKPNF